MPVESIRKWLNDCGHAVKIYRGARLLPPQRIKIDDYSQIDEGVRIFAGQGVEIGRYVHFAFNSSISGGGKCKVGDFVGVGAGARLLTGTEIIDCGGLTNPTIPDEFRSVRRGNIEIGKHALVFTNSVVLPDVAIGEGAVVGACCLVHHDLKPWCIYAGNPLVQVGVREPDPVLKRAEELLKSGGH